MTIKLNGKKLNTNKTEDLTSQEGILGRLEIN